VDAGEGGDSGGGEGEGEVTNEAVGAAIVILIGAALAVVVVRRIVSGKSYSTYPAMAVSRKADPFSFWLSLLFPTIFAVGLALAGMVGLWRAFNSNWYTTRRHHLLRAPPRAPAPERPRAPCHGGGCF
jgi:hypothetical protein